MILAPLRFQRAHWICRFGLCDRRGFRVEGDFVRGFEQVLPGEALSAIGSSERAERHRQLGMGFGDTEVSGPMQSEEAFHCAEALLDPEAAFGDQTVEALL